MTTVEVKADSRLPEHLPLSLDSCPTAMSEVRRIADLRPHPFLVKHTTGYSTQELSTLSERGEAAFSDPITITHESVIVEGYAVWQLARLQNRPTLTCIIRP